MEVCCNQKKKDIIQRNGNEQNFGSTRKFGNRSRKANRVLLVDQEEEDEEDEELDDDMMVMKFGGDTESTKPYYMEGFISGQRFKTMIDSGSPVTILALDEIKQIMKRKELQVRSMTESEKYIEFNGRPINLLGYIFCELQIGDGYIQKARILIAKNGTKSIVGREWLSSLRYKNEPQEVNGEVIVNSVNVEQLSKETKQFPKTFLEKTPNEN